MKAITPRRLVLMFIVVFAFPLLPVLISRDWAWWEAWVYALISATSPGHSGAAGTVHGLGGRQSVG